MNINMCSASETVFTTSRKTSSRASAGSTRTARSTILLVSTSDRDGENFTPLVNGTVLNPYLFNTDNLHEYLFLAKIKNQQTGIIATELWVANENGEVLRKFKGDDTKGDMSVCDVLDNRLVVSFANQAKGTSSAHFYNLPFEKFEKGGEGTAASPYKVSTVGDLMMIAQNPSAYYELVNDIDMSNVEWFADCYILWPFRWQKPQTA